MNVRPGSTARVKRPNLVMRPTVPWSSGEKEGMLAWNDVKDILLQALRVQVEGYIASLAELLVRMYWMLVAKSLLRMRHLWSTAEWHTRILTKHARSWTRRPVLLVMYLRLL